jgi:hypothetical protein
MSDGPRRPFDVLRLCWNATVEADICQRRGEIASVYG